MSFLKISAIIFFCFFNETGEFPFVSRLFKTACWSKAFVRSSRRSCDPGCGRCGLLFPKGGENFLVLGVRRDFGFEFGFEQYVTQLWALLNSYGAFLFQPSISQVRFRWQVPTSLPWARVLLSWVLCRSAPSAPPGGQSKCMCCGVSVGPFLRVRGLVRIRPCRRGLGVSTGIINRFTQALF